MQPPERDFVGDLTRRVRLAVADAERVVRRSETLAAARRVARDPSSLVRRCAWCGYLSFGSHWVAAEEAPRFLPESARERATHGICPDCLRRLERDGRTHALDAR